MLATQAQVPTPLWGQILFALAAPAVGAAVLWPIISSLYRVSGGGVLNERGQRHRRFAIRLFLVILYPFSLGIFVWSRIWPPGTAQPAFARAIASALHGNHALLSNLVSYAIAVPIFALLLWAFGRWILASIGVGRSTPFQWRRFLKEWAWVLAAVYAYVLGAAMLGYR